MIKIALAVIALALANASFAAQPEERDPATGLTHREKVAAERVEDARRVAAEPAWRPWHTEDARTGFGLPPQAAGSTPPSK